MGDTIDRHLKASHWNSTQVGDIKVLSELGRHQLLAAMATGSVAAEKIKYRDRDAVTKHIEPWIEASSFGLRIHSCSSLEVAHRLTSWALIYNLLIFGGDNIAHHDLAA